MTERCFNSLLSGAASSTFSKPDVIPLFVNGVVFVQPSFGAKGEGLGEDFLIEEEVSMID
jgi:hypothetical protein